MTCDHNGWCASESGERHGTLYFLCDVCKHERSVGLVMCRCRLDGWKDRPKVVRDFDEPDFMRCSGFEARFVPRLDPIPPGSPLIARCEVCGGEFERASRNHKYCSKACRKKSLKQEAVNGAY